MCRSYGCDAADASTMGYWTSSSFTVEDDSYAGAWGVNRVGRLLGRNVDYSSLGVRPVISVSKSLVKVIPNTPDTDHEPGVE